MIYEGVTPPAIQEKHGVLSDDVKCNVGFQLAEKKIYG